MRLLRLATFLFSRDELEWIFPVQDSPEKYMAYGDSDWGVSESRRSTSGTYEQFGMYQIEYSCSTQHVIVSSSGEAELDATGRAAAGGLQSVQPLAEASIELKLEALTDSTANIGMQSRVGSGRVRHLDVKWLWAEEALLAGRFMLKKIDTAENISDLTTKHHDEGRLKALMRPGDCDTAEDSTTQARESVSAQRPKWTRSQQHREQEELAEDSCGREGADAASLKYAD